MRLGVSNDLGTWPWSSNSLTLGGGFDSLRWEACGTAVTGTQQPGVIPGLKDGQRVSYFCEIIETERDFYEKMSISAAASVKKFGSGGSARMQFTKELKINQYSVSVVASVKVVDTLYKLVDCDFNEDANREWNKTSVRVRAPLWVRTFGDTYVDTITRGGEAFALFELIANSQEERTRIKAEIEGNMGSYSASSEYEKAVTSLEKYKRTRMDIKYDGTLERPPLNNLEDVLKFAINYPHSVRGLGVPIEFTNQTYSTVASPGMDLDVRTLSAHYELERLARYSRRVDYALRSFEYAEKNLALFSDSRSECFEPLIDHIQDQQLRCQAEADRIATERFDPALAFDSDRIGDIPIAPEVASGKSIPLKITVIGTDTNGNAVTAEGKNGDWVGGGFAIQGLRIESADGTNLPIKYMAHRTVAGNSPWRDVGTFTPGPVHEGFAIRTEPGAEDTFRVIYSLQRQDGAIFSAANGEYAGTTGRRQTQMMKVRVEIIVK